MHSSGAIARLIADLGGTHCPGWLLKSLALIGLIALAGCGGASNHGDRVPLTGTITVKGQPLDVKATVYFDPLPGQDGIGSAAEVSDSKFTISEDTGPTPGKQYKVRVITVPGIPAPGTPPAEIKRPVSYEKTIEVPQRGETASDLKIEF